MWDNGVISHPFFHFPDSKTIMLSSPSLDIYLFVTYDFKDLSVLVWMEMQDRGEANGPIQSAIILEDAIYLFLY